MASPFRPWIVLGAGILVVLALVAGPSPAAADSIVLHGITVAIVPAAPCANDPVAVQFTTCGCGVRFGPGSMGGNGVQRDVLVDPTIVCVRCDSLVALTSLGRFAAGSYSVLVHLRFLYGRDGVVDSMRTYDGALNFQVTRDCYPPPGVPYLGFVQVGGTAPCSDCRPVVCPGDSINVFLGGTFPDLCTTLDSIEVVAPPYASPLPQPDVLRLHFGHACGGCALTTRPWAAQARIGPLIPNDYTLRIEAYEAPPCSTDTAYFAGATAVPFTVVDSCGTPPPPTGCFFPFFEHTSGTACDAAVAPNQPGTVTLSVRTTVALAGLQGSLAFDTPGLAVTDAHAVGVAGGMLLTWQPTTSGADFVLVAPGGAPIVPAPPESLGAQPVLALTVSAVPGQPVPDRARLAPMVFIASDADGHDVPTCPIPLNARLIDPAAWLCRASACDFNGDGATDVRDLVVMARCILDATFACPPGAADHLDCNADGAKDLDDVLCCARVLLGGLRQPGDGSGRPAPDVRVVLGLPEPTAGGLSVPVTISGLAGVGAGRLDLTYPYPGYEALAIDQAGPAGQGWLALSQANRGMLSLGFVGLGAGASDTLRLAVPLARQDGAGAAGGEFALAGGEFAGTDGAALAVTPPAGSVPLGPMAAVALSAPRPNPFRGSTAFTVTLAEAQALDVSVYNLAGRRVATLFHGAAPAGPTPLTWDGSRDDGAPVGPGVYFVRVASARGDTAGRKLLVLSRE